jgi:hypothetical protein
MVVNLYLYLDLMEYEINNNNNNKLQCKLKMSQEEKKHGTELKKKKISPSEPTNILHKSSMNNC